MKMYQNIDELPGTVFHTSEDTQSVNLVPLKIGMQDTKPNAVGMRNISMQIMNFENGLLPAEDFYTALSKYLPAGEDKTHYEGLAFGTVEPTISPIADVSDGLNKKELNTSAWRARQALADIVRNPPKATTNKPGAPYKALAKATEAYIQAACARQDDELSGGALAVLAELSANIPGFKAAMIKEYTRPIGMRTDGLVTSPIGYLAAHSDDLKARQDALAYASMNQTDNAAFLNTTDVAADSNHPLLLASKHPNISTRAYLTTALVSAGAAVSAAITLTGFGALVLAGIGLAGAAVATLAGKIGNMFAQARAAKDLRDVISTTAQFSKPLETRHDKPGSVHGDDLNDSGTLSASSVSTGPRPSSPEVSDTESESEGEKTSAHL